MTNFKMVDPLEEVPLIPQFYLGILVYSTRPNALAQFLESYSKHVQCNFQSDLRILYKCDPSQTTAFDKLKSRYPHAQFIYRDGSEEQILSILKHHPAEKPGHELLPHFSFMQDSMLFYKDISF